MSISTILSTAVSGLLASSDRVVASAENIVNVNSDGYLAGDRRTKVGPSVVAGQAFGAGAVQVEALEPATIDISREFVALLTAEAAYKANIQIIRAAEEMHRETIDFKV